ncbi:protein Tob1-like, partial [Gryllus bimaculatus]
AAAAANAPSPTPPHYSKGSASPVTSFLPRSTAPLTFTTATFAQTKFGSTKLKTSSKRANRASAAAPSPEGAPRCCRMSPTEFSNYIKQRALQQQQIHGHAAPAPPPPHHAGPQGSP